MTRDELLRQAHEIWYANKLYQPSVKDERMLAAVVDMVVGAVRDSFKGV